MRKRAGNVASTDATWTQMALPIATGTPRLDENGALRQEDSGNSDSDGSEGSQVVVNEGDPWGWIRYSETFENQELW